jgi:predicted membrane protein
MRLGCLFGGFFWGAVLILLGIVLFLNSVFHINIPFFQILVALFFVYLGLRILIGRRHWHGVSRWGGDRHADPVRAGDRHDTIFGRSDVDLTGILVKDETIHVEVNAIFGASYVRISPATPMKIIASAAFGSVRLPNGSAEAFGEYVWKSSGLDESRPCVVLHAAAVFGSVRIDNR